MKTFLQTSQALLPAILAGALAIGAFSPVAASEASLSGVRNATAAFHDIDAANAAGYSVEVADLAGITCIADPGGAGVMGIHYLNPSLLDANINATTPELLIYEPSRGNSLKLIGVEYLVLQADWDAIHASPPSLFGEEFHLTPAGNRYGLPAFYELHAWIWKPNPNGMFFEWNPKVSC